MPRPRLGVLVDDLGASHLNWALIKSANRLVNRGDVDVVLFYEDLVRPVLVPQVALLPSVHATGFRGILVATSLHTARRLARVPAAARKLFYCWDLEWCRQPNKNYAELVGVYRSAAYDLVARTVEHATLLAQLWNRPVRDVVPEANLEGLLGVGLDRRP
jgi:hypothetical protein